MKKKDLTQANTIFQPERLFSNSLVAFFVHDATIKKNIQTINASSRTSTVPNAAHQINTKPTKQSRA